MPTRHLDTGIHEYDFARLDHWVLCPDCGAVGLSHRRVCGCHVFYYRQCGKSLNGHYQRQHRLINYSRQVFRYYASSSRFRCYHCGGKWLRGSHYLPNVGHTPKEFHATCPLCGHHSVHHALDAQHYVYAHYDSHLGMNDYGLELALRTPTRFGVLYVYNPTHLRALKDFIVADLRERTKDVGNGSYFSRLPTWIKSAKNRDELLKAIGRLEKVVEGI
jgi:hypothetical protein